MLIIISILLFIVSILLILYSYYSLKHVHEKNTEIHDNMNTDGYTIMDISDPKLKDDTEDIEKVINIADTTEDAGSGH